MPALTEEQARALADRFSKAAAAVSDFRYQAEARLTETETIQFKALEDKLLDLSDEFTATAITLTLDNMKQAINDLVSTTDNACAAVARLNDIRQVVTIAANLVALGKAIMDADPQGVLTALTSTQGAIAG